MRILREVPAIVSDSKQELCPAHTPRARPSCHLAQTFPLIRTKTEVMPSDPPVPNNFKNKVTKLEVMLVDVVNALREVHEC